ncbi:MAG: PQQ-binding-like beta-propeller repeat protein [Verrucomicrobiales bacterium]|nr:PQQ-binding-like beta-propeller repeat protein [Verrucomicrobiales bacterium]
MVIGFTMGADWEENAPDIYIAKLSRDDGSIFWERRIDGPAHGFDSLEGMAVDVNDDPVIIGTSASLTGVGDTGYIAKFNGDDGQLLWERRDGGPGAGFHKSFALVPDGAGNIVAAGNAFKNAIMVNPYAFYTVKYSGVDGTLLWEDLYDRAGDFNTCDALAVGIDGDAVVTGSSDGVFGLRQFVLLKYSGTSGQRKWQYVVELADGLSPGLAIGPQGDILVSGAEARGDAHVAVFSGATGSRLWEQRYDGPAAGVDRPVAVALAPDGNVVVTGSLSDGDDRDIYCAKYSVMNGSLVWEERYDGPKHTNDEPTAMVINKAGDLFIVGISEDQCFVGKWAGSDGHVIWGTRIIEDGAQLSMGYALSLDPAGNVIVCGYQLKSPMSGILIAKLSSDDGRVIWRGIDYGPGQAGASFGGMVTDSEGNVVVAGSAKSPGNPGEAYTAMYAGADGRLTWRQSFATEVSEGEVFGGSRFLGVTVASDGNLFATGWILDGQSRNGLTIKFRATDGSLLWHRNFSSAEGGEEEGLAVKSDDFGNTIVLGSSRINQDPTKTVLIHYSGENGRTLWQNVLDPSESTSGLMEMRLDGKGGVVITGTRSRGIVSSLITESHSLITGELNWRTPPKAGLIGRSLATDGNGAIAILAEGDMTVGGPDFVTLLYREVEMPRLTIQRGGAEWRLLIEGRRQHKATVLRSVDLKTWEAIGGVTGGEDGRSEFVDTNPPPTRAYYRVSVP